MTAERGHFERACGCRGAYLHEKPCAMAGLQIGEAREANDGPGPDGVTDPRGDYGRKSEQEQT